MNGGDYEAAFNKIDWVDVAIAAGEGAITSGASAGKTLLKGSLKAAIITGGEFIKAGADADIETWGEKGFQVVGEDKEMSDAMIDFFFDKAGKNLAESTLKGMKDVGEDLTKKGTYVVLTTEGRETAKGIKTFVISDAANKTVNSLFNFASGGATDVGGKEMFNMIEYSLQSNHQDRGLRYLPKVIRVLLMYLI